MYNHINFFAGEKTNGGLNSTRCQKHLRVIVLQDLCRPQASLAVLSIQATPIPFWYVSLQLGECRILSGHSRRLNSNCHSLIQRRALYVALILFSGIQCLHLS
ncbi:hypothetical protein VPH35_034784 [Triticum aestivum]|uniref:Uncharacterized protein n=1 Tax=Aegilops tauschii subsp. strangulata TaxID=200361 RepID=A0A453ALN8_AEGTS